MSPRKMGAEVARSGRCRGRPGSEAGATPTQKAGRPLAGAAGLVLALGVLHAATLGTRLLDRGSLALEQGVDRVAEIGLGHLGLVHVVIQRTGVADLPLLVEDEELRGVGGTVSTPHRLALIVA